MLQTQNIEVHAKIDHINQTVRSTLNPTRKPNLANSDTLDAESDILNCDQCEFDTGDAKEMRKYIVNKHSVNVFHGVELEVSNAKALQNDLQNQEVHSDEQRDTTEPQKFPCEKCEAELTTIQDIEKHNDLHFQAENLSLAFHVCRVCNKVVTSKELKIQCSKCIHIFHKKCTNKKDARGN